MDKQRAKRIFNAKLDRERRRDNEGDADSFTDNGIDATGN